VRINEAHQLLNATYFDWADFLANPRYIRNDPLITWAGHESFMLDHPVMASDISSLVDKKQYTFQVVADGSAFQIYYKYDRTGRILQSASLGFYCAKADDHILAKFSTETSPTESAGTDILNEDGNVDGEDIIDISTENKLSEVDEEAGPFSLKDGPISWLRIDYEPTAVKGVLHHECHMHLSPFPDARWVVAGVPNPRQFVEFVMSTCYPETYKNHRLDASGIYAKKNKEKIADINATCFPIAESTVFKQIVHLRIPVV
jgi:hypothetical protein